MNKFQELRTNEQDIFNVKIKFWYFLKYYLKSFFLDTKLKETRYLSNFTILILTKDELNKIKDDSYFHTHWYVNECWIYNWEEWFVLNNEYSLSDFELNKDFYLDFFQKVKYIFSSKNFVWEKQILLKIFWYHSLLTCFKMIFNSIHFLWLFYNLGSEHVDWLNNELFNEQNTLLKKFLDIEDKDFQNEMKILYDICYWFNISKLYYSLFLNHNFDYIKYYYSDFANIELLQTLWKDLKNTWKSYKKEYVFKEKWLEFFYLSLYLYFDKIKIFNEHYWKQFIEIWDEEKLSDFYYICQVLDEQVKLWKRDMN